MSRARDEEGQIPEAAQFVLKYILCYNNKYSISSNSMSILNGYVGEVEEELSRAAAAGINLAPSEALNSKNVADQSHAMLNQLLTSDFLQSVPEGSMAIAEELKVVLTRAALVGGAISRGEATDD